jgi:hypothetical protein
MINSSGKFAFLDEGETLRRLGVDRDTLAGFVHEKRLRAYPGVGKGSFFRSRDVDALLEELRGAAATTAAEQEQAPAGRKLFDPAYKVHVRLQADLKWYDLEDEDLRAWVREMTADGYTRQRTNITRVIEKLQRLVQLMDEAADSWKTLAPERPSAPPVAGPGQPIQPTPGRRPRKPLPMAGTPPEQQGRNEQGRA